MRTTRWLILIFLQAAAVAWAYTSVTHLLAASPNRQTEIAQFHSTSQPESADLTLFKHEQMEWGKQSLFSVACCLVVLAALLINWVIDGRPPRGGENQ